MSDKIYIKVNGVWREADSVYRKRNGLWHKASEDVYKKINGAWVNQGDKSAIFDRDALFLYNGFRVDENVSAHVDVTCFDGGDGSVTVVASGGTPPYQYSLDPTFATYNSTGVFTGLSLIAPVDEGTDQYGGILISHRTFYVRDAEGQTIGGIIDLKSPVQLDYIIPESFIFIAENCNIYTNSQTGYRYAIIIEPFTPYVTTNANGCIIITHTQWPPNNMFRLSSDITTYNMVYLAMNNCNETADKHYTITIVPAYFPNAIQDYDGNWYDAVVIGDQVWLASNLRTAHYADGTPIPAGGSTTSDTDPYYYDYSSSNIPIKDRGYLYNFPAVMNGESPSDLNPSGVQGIAPTGWHVPSDAEWTQLIDYVGSVPEYILDNNTSYIAKALTSQSYWNASTNAYAVGNDLTANNKTLFGVVPAGDCTGSSFGNSGNLASLWSSTLEEGDPISCYIGHNSKSVGMVNFAAHEDGYSVRCVCDLSPLDFAAWYYNQYGSYNHQITA